MQLVGLKAPEPVVANETVPVGVAAVPVDASLTVAVHVEGALTGTEAGVQATLVADDLFVTVSTNGVLLLLLDE